jgi:hypothetical protein
MHSFICIFHSSVRIDLHQLVQWPTNPLTSRPDWGPSPRRGWWAPVAQPYKEEVGTGSSRHEVHRRHCSPPQTLIRSKREGCSGGKRHRLAVTSLHRASAAPASCRHHPRRLPRPAAITTPTIVAATASTTPANSDLHDRAMEVGKISPSEGLSNSIL